MRKLFIPILLCFSLSASPPTIRAKETPVVELKDGGKYTYRKMLDGSSRCCGNRVKMRDGKRWKPRTGPTVDDEKQRHLEEAYEQGTLNPKVP